MKVDTLSAARLPQTTLIDRNTAKLNPESSMFCPLLTRSYARRVCTEEVVAAFLTSSRVRPIELVFPYMEERTQWCRPLPSSFLETSVFVIDTNTVSLTNT